MKAINKIKTRYYSKEILKYLFLSGAVCLAATSPYFALNLSRNIFRGKKIKRKKNEYAFSYLKKRGLVEIKRNGYDISISLTQEGKKRAGKYQIDDLTINVPKKWDKKWRIIIFDIPIRSRSIRDIFRRKLKEFGFHCFQQSIWIYPYPCGEEIKFLRDFLGLSKRHIQVIEAFKLEDDSFLRKKFKIS